MTSKSKKIVIVGAGFGGLAAALGLEKKFRNSKDTEIVLVDKHDYQQFSSNLYEVATAEEEFTSINQLKKSVALPISEILKGKKITFIKGELKLVNQKEKKIKVGIKDIPYTVLILALGSQIDFMGVEGAKEFSLPLKTLPDALRIRNQIEFLIHRHRLDTVKKNLRIVIAGGGYTAVEFAGELAEFLNIVVWKNNYLKQKLEVLVLEAANKLIPGLSHRLSEDAFWRLKHLGVRVQTSSPIQKVDHHFVELSSGEKIEYDLLIWSTGIKANAPEFSEQVTLDKKQRLPVNGYLQVEGHEDIFVIGDESCFLDENGKPVPATAQDAIHQGKYLAYSLPLLLANKKPNGYSCLKHGFVVPIGGKWAILKLNNFYLKGFLAFVVGKLSHLRYFISILGVRRAVRFIYSEVEIYGRND